jgi:hypothetical protein
VIVCVCACKEVARMGGFHSITSTMTRLEPSEAKFAVNGSGTWRVCWEEEPILDLGSNRITIKGCTLRR